MAITLIVLQLLGIAGLILMVFGILNIAKEQGVALFSLAGIVFLLMGLLLWTGGLETNNITTITDNGTEFTYTSQVLTSTNDQSVWLFSNILFWGGVIAEIIAFTKIASIRRDKIEAQAEYY